MVCDRRAETWTRKETEEPRTNIYSEKGLKYKMRSSSTSEQDEERTKSYKQGSAVITGSSHLSGGVVSMQ